MHDRPGRDSHGPNERLSHERVCRVPSCCTIPAYVAPKIVPSLRTKLVEKKRNDASGAASPGDALRRATAVRLKGLDVRISLPVVAVAAHRAPARRRLSFHRPRKSSDRATERPSHRAIEPSRRQPSEPFPRPRSGLQYSVSSSSGSVLGSWLVSMRSRSAVRFGTVRYISVLYCTVRYWMSGTVQYRTVPS